MRPEEVLRLQYPNLKTVVSEALAKNELLKSVASKNSLASLSGVVGRQSTIDISRAIQEQFDFDQRNIAMQAVASANAHMALRGVGGTAAGNDMVRWVTDFFGQELNHAFLAESMFKQVREAAMGVSSFIQDQRRLDEQIDEFVLKHNWPLPLHIGARTFRRIVALSKQGKRAVSAEMKKAFAPGTTVFASSVDVLRQSPHFITRRPILDQSMKAYRRREWYLVINSLLPLVEGVLVDSAYGQDSRPTKGGPKKAFERLERDELIGLEVASRSMETILLAGGANVAIFHAYDPNRYGRPGEPRVLNRNAILHGAARRYGTEENALRLLLLLTMMAESLDSPAASTNGNSV